MKDIIPLDVHSLSLDEAKIVINKEITRCYNDGTSVLKVNHGFNRGNKIKNWCLKNGDLNPLVDKVVSGENEGITHFYIKIKIY